MIVGWLIALGEVIGAAVPVVGATKRLIKAARDTEPPPAALPVPKPLGRGDYTDGLLAATERQRAKLLGEKMQREAAARLNRLEDD